MASIHIHIPQPHPAAYMILWFSWSHPLNWEFSVVYEEDSRSKCERVIANVYSMHLQEVPVTSCPLVGINVLWE